nr:terminase [Clostridia bacterium]
MLETSHYDKARADRAVMFIENLCHTKGKWEGQPFWLFPWQEQIVRDVFGIVDDAGRRQFKTAYVEIPKKQGKQLALDTPIPTPKGFTAMGEIKVGDEVFDEHGRICHVVAKSPVDYEEQGYRITFMDGESIVAGARHQWKGELTAGKIRPAVITTEELFRLPKDGNSYRFRIPVASALNTPDADLPISPYLMGYWLGNGNAVKPEITIQTCDIPEVLSRIPEQIQSDWQNTGNSRVVRIPALRAVLLPSFHDKRIPRAYLRASVQQRLELLQGLMDSDGAISNVKGQAIYSSAEKALAESVSDLLWSLGIKNATETTASTQRTDWTKPSRECGRVATGETIYTVKFTAFDDLPIAGLERKQKNAVPRNPKTRSHFRYIRSVEKIQNPGMQCIQVDSPSHLYLAGRSCMPTHNSELAAAVALYLLYADGEASPEVYGAAADRQQASIVFDVAKRMVEMSPALMKRSKIAAASKRIVNFSSVGYYQVLSAEAYTKHGFSVSGLVFDEVHTQPNRNLYDVLTKGSGDAREQPLYFLITTAGNDKESLCYELHTKAQDILDGRKFDPRFYPVVYGLRDTDDWTDEANWYKANPSLGLTIRIDSVRDMFREAMDNPAEENVFKQLRLNMWVASLTRFIPEQVYDLGNVPIDMADLEGRDCYAGLDLSSTNDITALVLMFPPRDENEKYVMLPFFWIPEDSIPLRVRRSGVPYDVWHKQGYLNATEGNVIHYSFIEKFIEDLGQKYHICEIAFDRWGATQMVQDLEGMGFTVVPFGQGFKDMSPPTKEFIKLLMEGRIIHGGNPVLRWMSGNVIVDRDAAENIKPTKAKSPEKIDGIVAAIMALDRCIRRRKESHSVYDDRGLCVF